ncbi:uncharacterized protein [Haliotis asinina]|uniref:uncharacterized protein n=1 Tax=Haliotis asinina TaxID=109174 RepID=UPI0035321840
MDEFVVILIKWTIILTILMIKDVPRDLGVHRHDRKLKNEVWHHRDLSPEIALFSDSEVTSWIMDLENQTNEKVTTEFGRALLANERLVSNTYRRARTTNTTITRLEESSHPPPYKANAWTTIGISSSCMDHIKTCLKCRAYSVRAAKAITLALRKSTPDKWKCFEAYARKKGFLVNKATNPQIADYLCYLRQSKGLKGSTLSTYLAALSSVITMGTGTKLTEVPERLALLHSFNLEDQQHRFRAPALDLNVVLQHRTSDANEPLDQTSVEMLTQKTLFLLALATAARMSEIHALDFNRTKFDRSHQVTGHLGLRWDFIAKNQLPGQPDRQFHIPSMSSILGPHDTQDLSLCPVRALKICIACTKSRRQRFKHLFIHKSSETPTEVSHNTVSLWIITVILRAYKAAGLDPLRASNPHEVRALASTITLHGNYSLSTIMEGCFFTCET